MTRKMLRKGPHLENLEEALFRYYQYGKHGASAGGRVRLMKPDTGALLCEHLRHARAPSHPRPRAAPENGRQARCDCRVAPVRPAHKIRGFVEL